MYEDSLQPLCQSSDKSTCQGAFSKDSVSATWKCFQSAQVDESTSQCFSSQGPSSPPHPALCLEPSTVGWPWTIQYLPS